MKKNIHKFYIFLMAHLFIWTAIPLLRGSMPMDSLEAIIWGQSEFWGNPKHPPFSGWVANVFFSCLGQSDFSIYFLSQIFVIIGLIYIYKIARLFLSEEKSLFSALLMEGVIYYTFQSTEFNVNVISLALWPMCSFYLYQSVKYNKLKYWFILGVVVGLNILNKYTAGLWLIGMLLYLLFNLNQFKNWRLYFSGLVALLIICPHLFWLYENDFITLNYIGDRTSKTDFNLMGHFIYPIKFLIAQMLSSCLLLFGFAILWLKGKKEKRIISKDDKKFVWSMFFPIFVFPLIALLSGNAVKSMWGYPMIYMVGIILFLYFPFKVKSEKSAYVILYSIMGISVVLSVFKILNTRSVRFHFPIKNFVAEIQDRWDEKYPDLKIKYVGGYIWYTSIISLYHPNQPIPILSDKYKVDYPIIIIDDSANKMENPIKAEVEVKNYFGKKKKYNYFYEIRNGNNLQF